MINRESKPAATVPRNVVDDAGSVQKWGKECGVEKAVAGLALVQDQTSVKR